MTCLSELLTDKLILIAWQPPRYNTDEKETEETNFGQIVKPSKPPILLLKNRNDLLHLNPYKKMVTWDDLLAA